MLISIVHSVSGIEELHNLAFIINDVVKIVTKSILCKWQESKVILHMVKLSKRLYSVVNYIPKGSVIADIGSDHAYLPIFAVQNGYAIKAIAGEVVQGPFEAQNQVF